MLWACPLLQADLDTYIAALETIKESEVQKTNFIILPAQDTLLIDAVEQVFKESEIQIDLKDFQDVVTDLLPGDYKDAFKESFTGAFKNDDLRGFTQDLIELIEKSLSHHNLKEALNKFSRLKKYLLTLFKHDINYFFNIQPVKNLRKQSYPKRNPDENYRSFLIRVLEGFRSTTWGIPCVYMDEISIIFDEFNST